MKSIPLTDFRSTVVITKKHIKAIKLTIKDDAFKKIKCPYCGSSVRRYGFYLKKGFNASNNTFTNYLIQRCQCRNASCPYTDSNSNKHNVTFAILPTTLTPFTSATVEDLDYISSFLTCLKENGKHLDDFILSTKIKTKIITQLAFRFNVMTMEIRRKNILNRKNDLYENLSDFIQYQQATIKKGNQRASDGLELYNEAPSPNFYISRKSSHPPPKNFMAGLYCLLNEAVPKVSTYDLWRKGVFFRKLTLPMKKAERFLEKKVNEIRNQE